MYDPNIHHRRSIRLPGYDYTQAGVYFVTVCVQERACLLGRISDSQMQESAAGQMVRTAWAQIPIQYPGVDIGQSIIMPNHVHGILVLTESAQKNVSLSLPDVLQRWKSWTTTLYRHGVHEQAWPPFPARLWQRNYYERIVRDEDEWRAVQDYIINNPARWQTDEEHIP